MSYCTQTDIETRIGADDLVALADHDGDGVADQAVVAEAIESAEALMDSYMAMRFSVPVLAGDGSPPPALTTRAVNLAVYFLRLGRDSVTEDARAQYEDDLAWLAAVAAGRVAVGTGEAPAESARAGGVRHESEQRLFGRDEPL